MKMIRKFNIEKLDGASASAYIYIEVAASLFFKQGDVYV